MTLSKIATLAALAALIQPSFGLDCPTAQIKSDTPAPADSSNNPNQSLATALAPWTEMYDFYLQIYQVKPHDSMDLAKGTTVTISYDAGPSRTQQTQLLSQAISLSNSHYTVFGTPAIQIPATAIGFDGDEPSIEVDASANALYTDWGRLFGHVESEYAHLHGTPMLWVAHAEVPMGSVLDSVKASLIKVNKFPMPATFASDKTMYEVITGASANGIDGSQLNSDPTADSTIFLITRKPKDPAALAKLVSNYKVGDVVVSEGAVVRITGIDADTGSMNVQTLSKTGPQPSLIHVLQISSTINQNIASNPYQIGEKLLRVESNFDDGDGQDLPQVTSDVATVTALTQNAVVDSNNELLFFDEAKKLEPQSSLCGLKIGDRVSLTDTFFADEGGYKIKKSKANSPRALYTKAEIAEAMKCRATVAQIDDSGLVQLNWDPSSCDLRSLSSPEEYDATLTTDWIHISVLNKVSQ